MKKEEFQELLDVLKLSEEIEDIQKLEETEYLLKNYKVDNAIIMAAGTSSRFAPLSYEKPKGLIEVKGEVLIERQIRQLKKAGISEIVVVVGYKKEQFYYLEEKFGVKIIVNPEFETRNNHASLYYARDYLKNTYICSADNYFEINVFEKYEYSSFYSSVFVEGKTNEWCLVVDERNVITEVSIGGNDAWVMMGHVYFNLEFSEKFKKILLDVYDDEAIKSLLWESIYVNNLTILELSMKKYNDNEIFEFDTLDELRLFDQSYINETRSSIIKKISQNLNCSESEIVELKPVYLEKKVKGFSFELEKLKYEYIYDKATIVEARV